MNKTKEFHKIANRYGKLIAELDRLQIEMERDEMPFPLEEEDSTVMQAKIIEVRKFLEGTQEMILDHIQDNEEEV